MPFDPLEKMKSVIHVPGTNFTEERTIGTIDQLVEWSAAGVAQANFFRRRISKLGQVGAELADALEQPFAQLNIELGALDLQSSTKADIAAIWKRAKNVIEVVSTGASIGPKSPIATASTSLNSPWSMLGFLTTAIGFHVDNIDEKTLAAAHQTNRGELAAGAAVAAYLGLLPSDPTPYDVKKLREAIKTANQACKEIERLRIQNQTAAENWEEVRTSNAEATDEHMTAMFNEQMDLLKQLHQDHNDRMALIESNFKDRLVLGGPASYWDVRAKATFWSAYRALIVFIVFVLGIVWAASTIGLEHVKQVLVAIQTAPVESVDAEVVATPGLGSTLLGFALITTPAVMALWVLMLISRIFRENFHLSNDARHRHMLITTYLALAEDADNPIDDTDRQYALSAIFSVPTEAGADDALTAMGSVVGRR
jgi:hypothetical protein